MRDLADDKKEAAVQPDLADRVLRTRSRRRTRRYAGLITAVAAIVAVAVAVPLLGPGTGGSDPAVEIPQQDIIARPDQSPPRQLVAAGDVAVSAYRQNHKKKLPGKEWDLTPVWHLYHPATKRYEKTNWAWLDVAPGMQQAAVLERGLPADRIGILNLDTWKVDRWILVPKGVGGVEFSPDGKRLVATAYARNPDGRFWDAKEKVNGKDQPGPKASRTGFYIVDVASGEAVYHRVGYPKDLDLPKGMPLSSHVNPREDFGWNADGTLLYEFMSAKPYIRFLTTDGKQVPAPPKEKHRGYPTAGLSPDGTYMAGDFAGEGNKTSSYLLDPDTGKPAKEIPGQQLLAWADSKRVIAWDCHEGVCGKGRGEFDNELVLVDIEKETTTVLTGGRGKKDDAPGRWTAVFTPRR
nr:WD40 repeat domain-containing protein [Streptomyces coryli]